MRAWLPALLVVPALLASSTARGGGRARIGAPAAKPASAAVVKRASAAAKPASAAVAFPRLTTEDLNGVAQQLPDGLPGALKLLVIAYRRDHQRDVDPWISAGLRLERAHAEFRVFELPTLGLGWQAARQWIDDGMRSGIPDRAARARTLTLYIDKAPFNQALGIATERTIHALLVDARGEVVWRRSGPPDDAALEALAGEVQRRLR